MNDHLSVRDAALKLLELCSSEPLELGRIEVKCDRTNLLECLRVAQVNEKLYWSDRKRTIEWVGLGLSQSQEQESDYLRFFAIPFRGDAPQTFSPIVEIRTTDHETIIAVDRREKSPAIPILRDLVENNAPSKAQLATAASDVRLFSFEQFRDKFNRCKELLSENKLDKIVLANAHDFFFEEAFDPVALLQFLDEQAPCTYRFLMQLSQGKAFVGASPELLFSRQGRRIESEAQAGTKSRGRNAAQDSALSFELLESQKEFIEHDLVIQDIERALTPLCVDSGWIDQRQVVKLSHVQHLRSRFGGILKPDVTDAQILETLHPTAAVCGSPKPLAKTVIEELEGFDRGYYGGALGLISNEQTQLAVGLRSALVEDKRVRIFAGAGLVGGSRAEDEWDEIDSKMQLYYSALGRARS